MGIKSLFGFGQARDKPVDKAADAGYSFLFGRTTSGKPVNERNCNADHGSVCLCQDTCGSNCILKKDYTKAEKYLNVFFRTRSL